MDEDPTKIQLANQCAAGIHKAFDYYNTQFKAITQRAKKRFESRDWGGMQADSAERLDLYEDVVDRTVFEISRLFGERLQERTVWTQTKTVYTDLVRPLDVWELAETFFNSVTRRVFATVGVNPQIEFVDTCSRTAPFEISHLPYRTYREPSSTVNLITTILADYQFQTAYEDLNRDARLVAEKVDDQFRAAGVVASIDRVEMVTSVFYRGKGAYLIGRMFGRDHRIPLILAVLNTSRGTAVDAVLLNENEVSILFSFTRSYFHVDVSRPSALVGFLKSIMPRKRVAELYISIGYNKHGKSELYCDLLQHLSGSKDKFEIAAGEMGMVMMVFTMPSYDIVFKVIKDQFGESKNTTRRAVMDKYHLVFKHDRAGRLVDAQEFEHLKFSRIRFSEGLLNKLQSVAAKNVIVNKDHVVIKHAYVERRVIPLNVYLREADDAEVRKAVVDYGNAIKDLAATNIFPGDMLLKNFGVTRHGRVVFYDYDELCLLDMCNFRAMPQSRSDYEELSAEPWFPVDDNDVFPEEFQYFLGLQGRLKKVFLERHSDLFQVQFWRRIQGRFEAEGIIDIFPYGHSQRLQRSKH
ncbi:MAG: bifunctional isocitrate dehydrogenase kinase/phosphatase [Deltaproteobacteria bacterium]|nr:MAG: bifunctional isocitrate dehydrogenase kinase/phosphatase [Deltaproteobacteria bacterium]